MLKAPLTYHDPKDIYNFFRDEVGPLYMMIKKNHAVVRFENAKAIVKFIANSGTPIVKGMPLRVSLYKEGQLQNAKAQKQSNRMDQENILNANIDLGSYDQFQRPFYAEIKQLYSEIDEKIRKLDINYQCRAKEVRQRTGSEDLLRVGFEKINKSMKNQISKIKRAIVLPLKQASVQVKQSNTKDSQAIDLEQSFEIVEPEVSQKQESTNFSQGLIYSLLERMSVKRMCALNNENFIVTQMPAHKQETKGILRIFKEQQPIPQFSIDISEGPYSLLCHQNFILCGDSYGKVHFIDTLDQNSIETSNKLHNGLILDMQKYDIAYSSKPSILTLLANDYRVKRFTLETEWICPETRTLNFEPKEEIECGDIIMTLATLGNECFAYGSKANIFYHKSIDRPSQVTAVGSNVMKLQKCVGADHLMTVASENDIFTFDVRTLRVTQKHCSFNFNIKTIEGLSENLVFYGGWDGEVGVIDKRKSNKIMWENRKVHESRVNEIIRHRNKVITGDMSGIIAEWDPLS